MAETRVRKGKRQPRVEYPLPPESTKSMEQLEAEYREAVFKCSYQRAMRLAHYMHESFGDVKDGTNTECKAYVEKLRAAVAGGDASDVSLAGKPAAGEDFLAEAIRAAMTDAPAADADEEECERFAADLAGARIDGVTGDAGVGKMLRAACPDLPEAGDEDACREYISKLAAGDGGAGKKLELLEKIFGDLFDALPEGFGDSEESLDKVRAVWADFGEMHMADLRKAFRGALREDD